MYTWQIYVALYYNYYFYIFVRYFRRWNCFHVLTRFLRKIAKWTHIRWIDDRRQTYSFRYYDCVAVLAFEHLFRLWYPHKKAGFIFPPRKKNNFHVYDDGGTCFGSNMNKNYSLDFSFLWDYFFLVIFENCKSFCRSFEWGWRCKSKREREAYCVPFLLGENSSSLLRFMIGV